MIVQCDICRTWWETQIVGCLMQRLKFVIPAASPAKRLKKRHKVLGNIHSLVFLLNNLQNRLTKLVADTESEAKVGTFVERKICY